MVLPHCFIGTTCLVAPLGIFPIGAGLEGWFGVAEVGETGLGFGLGLIRLSDSKCDVNDFASPRPKNVIRG